MNAHFRFFKLLSLLCIIGLVISCKVSSSQIAGLYLGMIQDPADKTSELLLQLTSNGKFNLKETMYGDVLQVHTFEGNWTFINDTIVLTSEGLKDIHFEWDRGFIRHVAAQQAHPDLPFDAVSLRRIGP